VRPELASVGGVTKLRIKPASNIYQLQSHTQCAARDKKSKEKILNKNFGTVDDLANGLTVQVGKVVGGPTLVRAA